MKRLLPVLGVVLGVSSLAFGQDVEMEPNNTCLTAQDLGAVTFPVMVAGSLDTPPTFPDIDFFKVTVPTTSPALVRVHLEGLDSAKGVLDNPLVGVFDSNCNVITADDDTGYGRNATVLVPLPADGVVIVAATSSPDYAFTGQGSSFSSYQLTVDLPPLAGPIIGRLVDKISGAPLPGDAPPYAFVQLFRCVNGGTSAAPAWECQEFVNQGATDSDGQFAFGMDYSARPLTAECYHVSGVASQYQPHQTTPFCLGPGAETDIGHVRLPAFPIQFSQPVACQSLGASGGTCQYSLTIRNGLSTTLNGTAWSVVSGSGIGELLPAAPTVTRFQPPKQAVTLAAGASSTLTFQFTVPPSVGAGAYICTEVFVGKMSSPGFTPLGYYGPALCMTKVAASGFVLVPAQEAYQRLFAR